MVSLCVQLYPGATCSDMSHFLMIWYRQASHYKTYVTCYACVICYLGDNPWGWCICMYIKGVPGPVIYSIDTYVLAPFPKVSFSAHTQFQSSCDTKSPCLYLSLCKGILCPSLLLCLCIKELAIRGFFTEAVCCVSFCVAVLVLPDNDNLCLRWQHISPP